MHARARAGARARANYAQKWPTGCDRSGADGTAAPAGVEARPAAISTERRKIDMQLKKSSASFQLRGHPWSPHSNEFSEATLAGDYHGIIAWTTGHEWATT